MDWRWSVIFDDEYELEQPTDDKYSHHDGRKAHNPSAWQDVLDYEAKGHRIVLFTLINENNNTEVCLPVKKDEKLVYFRRVEKQINIESGEEEAKTVKYFYGTEKDGKQKLRFVL